MEKTKKNIIILIASLLCISLLTSCVRFLGYVQNGILRLILLVLLNYFNGLIAFIAMKLTNMTIYINLKNKIQFLIGLMVALGLSILIAFLPAKFGFSLVGDHLEFSFFTLIENLLMYILVIGPVEEFIFRVYLQDAFVSFFSKNKWIGVVIASFLFGLWHIINGNIAQVIFTFGIGLVFGFVKYKVKKCEYLGIAFAHGLYDFLNIIVRMFVI